MEPSEKRQTALFIGLNATGHINSLLGIADRLKDTLNFRTIFLIPGPLNVRTIEKHGHELLAMIDQQQQKKKVVSDPDEKYSKWTTTNYAMNESAEMLDLEPLECYVRMFDETGFASILRDHMLEEDECVEKVVQDLQPDLVVLDTWYLQPSILKLNQIPWVYVCSASPTLFLLPKAGSKQSRYPPCLGVTLWDKSERERMRQEEPEKWKQIQDEWRRINYIQENCKVKDARFIELFAKWGLEYKEVGPTGYFSPHLNIYQFPKEIDYDQEDDLLEYPERWFRCDSFIRRSAEKSDAKEVQMWTEKLDEAMKGKEAMVYFSLGTVVSSLADVLQRFIDILKSDTKRLYVVSKGVDGDLIELDPKNMIGANYLPQTFFLQRADLAIIHGGNNSTTECLYYGIPMIVLPCFGDQIDNAQRISDLKLGKRLHIKKTTKEELFDAIEQVITDTTMIKRLKEISKNMQSRDDLRKVTMMLKKLADEKKLDEEFIDECRRKRFEDIKF